jgi:hypothetical protein
MISAVRLDVGIVFHPLQTQNRSDSALRCAIGRWGPRHGLAVLGAALHRSWIKLDAVDGIAGDADSNRLPRHSAPMLKEAFLKEFQPKFEHFCATATIEQIRAFTEILIELTRRQALGQRHNSN